MRPLRILLLGVLVFVSCSTVAAATQTPVEAQEIADDLKNELGLDPNRAAGDGAESSPPRATPQSSGGGVASIAQVVFVPVRLVTNGLIDLSLGLLNGIFLGVNEGAKTFGAAAADLGRDPVASTAIAVVAMTLLGVSSLTFWALPRYGSLGGVPLFSRIARSELLDNKVRSDIFELIRANPGINVSEVSRRLDIAWGTTTHHLAKLRAERLVAIRLVARQKCYFPNGGSYTPHEMDVLSVTKQPTARRIAEFLVAHGPKAHQDIAMATELSPALVSYHLSKLVRSGLVSSERVGRNTVFTPLERELNPAPRPMVHVV